MKRLVVLLAVAVGLLAAAPALAQTSNDQYGKGESVTVTGVIQKQGITSYQYGTHFIEDTESGTGYALKSSRVDLDRYAGERVTVHGTVALEAGELEGGPALIDVSRVVPVSSPPDNGGSTSVGPGSGPMPVEPGGGIGNGDSETGGGGTGGTGGGEGVGVLPDTGGLPLSGLVVAGVALLASGLLIRRATR